jgi:hypothetical protein
MPSVRLLETREANTRNIVLFSSQKALEGFTQSIRKHLHGGSGNNFPTPSLESKIQFILRREGVFLLILLLQHSKHLVIELAGLDEASHKLLMLLPIHVQPIFKRSHALHFTGLVVKCRVVEISLLPQPQKKESLLSAV